MKEELNQEIGKLKASLEAHESQVKDLQQDLKVAERKLADANKPKLTEKVMESIQIAIEKAVDDYDFCDVDRYDLSLNMYDRTIELEDIEFNERGTLADEIYESVEDLFGIADDEEENTEVDTE